MTCSVAKRAFFLVSGLIIASLGIYLTIQANIGLSPWEAFASGISIQTGMSFGNSAIVISVAILGVDFFMKEKIGVGSILNAVGIGAFVDFFEYIKLIPKMTEFLPGVGLLILGATCLAGGGCLFLAARTGGGPRDALMVGMGKRLSRWPIGLVRIAIESVVLLVGWLLGAKVGLGTIISVFSMGLCLQLITKVFHFELRSIPQDSVLDTLKLITKRPSLK